ILAGMLHARNRPLQFRSFITRLISPIQLALDRENFILLRRSVALMIMIHGRAPARLMAGHGAIELDATLLKLRRRPLAQWRILRRCRRNAGRITGISAICDS